MVASRGKAAGISGTALTFKGLCALEDRNHASLSAFIDAHP
jgi:hypothetical protein